MLPPNSCTLPLIPHRAGRGVRTDRHQALSIHILFHLAGTSLDSYTPSMIYQVKFKRQKDKKTKYTLVLYCLFQSIFQSAVETGSLIRPRKPSNVLPPQKGIYPCVKEQILMVKVICFKVPFQLNVSLLSNCFYTCLVLHLSEYSYPLQIYQTY